MIIEFPSNLEWPCWWSCFSRESSSNRRAREMRKVIGVPSFNCLGLYWSKSAFHHWCSICNSQDSMPFLLQIPKTASVDDDVSPNQKELWEMVENWWRILRLKMLSSWAILREWRSFRSNLGNCESLLWLGNDLEYIWTLNHSLIHLISQIGMLSEIDHL